MNIYDGSNFYKFDDFSVGDLVFCYGLENKKNIGVVIEVGLNYLKIHWSKARAPTTFDKSEIEEWGFGFCKYKDRKKYKDIMK